MCLLALGCRPAPLVPTREDLISVLGELADDVRVLGGVTKSNRRATNPQNTPSHSPIEAQTKLWVVESREALPTPIPKASTVAPRVSKIEAKTLDQAFPAQLVYQIAEATGVSPQALPAPLPGSLSKMNGRLIEWSRPTYKVRLRSIQTISGWLTIIEAISD